MLSASKFVCFYILIFNSFQNNTLDTILFHFFDSSSAILIIRSMGNGGAIYFVTPFQVLWREKWIQMEQMLPNSVYPSGCSQHNSNHGTSFTGWEKGRNWSWWGSNQGSLHFLESYKGQSSDIWKVNSANHQNRRNHLVAMGEMEPYREDGAKVFWIGNLDKKEFISFKKIMKARSLATNRCRCAVTLVLILTQ